MATKIGKQQRKKRFTEAGVVFTEAFVSRVNRLTGGGAGGGDGPHGSPAAAAAEAVGGDGVHTLHLNGGAANEGAGAATEASSSFVEGMRGFTILGSTYAEIEALKGLIDALVRLGRGGTDGSASCTSGGGASCAQTPNDVGGSHGSGVDDDADACVPHPSFEACARVFLGVMFLGNSRPLHRHLITSVRRLPPAARAMAEAALIEEVLDALAQGRRCAGSGAAKLRSMTALASINGCQPQTGMEQRVMRRVAVPAAALVAEGEEGSCMRRVIDSRAMRDGRFSFSRCVCFRRSPRGVPSDVRAAAARSTRARERSGETRAKGFGEGASRWIDRRSRI